jgi:hypothetical protein
MRRLRGLPEFVRAVLAVDANAAPELTEDQVDELTRVVEDGKG